MMKSAGLKKTILTLVICSLHYVFSGVSFSHAKVYKINSTKKKSGVKTSISKFEEREQTDQTLYQAALAKNKIRVAILAPFTGKYSDVGKHMSDGALYSSLNSDIKNISFTNFDTQGTKEGTEKCLQQIIDQGIEIIIGPFLPTEMSVVSVYTDNNPQSNMKFFALDSNTGFAKRNFYIFGASKAFLAGSLASYVEGFEDRKNVAIVLPKTSQAFYSAKKIKKLFRQMNFNIMTVEYIDGNNPSKAVNGIINNYKGEFFADQDGNSYEENYREIYGAQKNEDEDKANLVKTIEKTNLIYVSQLVSPAQFNALLVELKEKKMLDKDIQIITHESLITDSVIKNPLSNGVLFAGLNSFWGENTEVKIEERFGYKPSTVFENSYDITALIISSFNNGALDEILMFRNDGFFGLNGDFRVTDSGYVERVPVIYKVLKAGVKPIYKYPSFI